jgi:hypothetical protein
MLLARPKASWQSLMHFRVAVKPDGHPTAVHIADSPFSKNGPDRLVVGDDAGVLYVFNMDGSLIAQHHNAEGSTITALASVRVRCDASELSECWLTSAKVQKCVKYLQVQACSLPHNVGSAAVPVFFASSRSTSHGARHGRHFTWHRPLYHQDYSAMHAKVQGYQEYA